jgi:hypothetical protein
LAGKVKKGADISEESVKSIKALMHALTQTIKTYRLYGSSHSTPSKFLDRLIKDFRQHFDQYDSFSIHIAEAQITYHGHVVYETQDAQDIKGSMSFLFFKDGIRGIHFLKGLEDKELEDFLNLVRKNDLLDHLEDDLVTLFWERDFTHIDFVIVDDFLEDSAYTPGTYEDLLRGLEYNVWEAGIEGGGIGEIEGESEAEVGGKPVGHGGGIKTDAGAIVPEKERVKLFLDLSSEDAFMKACALNADEMEKIDREVEEEQQPERLYVLIKEIMEIVLHLDEDIDAYENMIVYFKQTIESFLQEGQIGKAVFIFENVHHIINSMILKDKQVSAFNSILEFPSSPRSIALLGKAIKGIGAGDSGSIHQYFQFLTKEAIEPLCNLLKELEPGKWRKWVSDLLIELCKEEIRPLSKNLLDTDPFFVSNLLYILGRIRHPSTPEYLGKMVTYPDLKIRMETLQLLSKFGVKGIGLVQKLLRDPSPEIRARASLALAKMDKNRAVRILTEIILSEDFYKRDYEEKVSFFKALGETGSKEAIRVLQGISKEKKWFKGAKWNEMRLCAANTLKLMETEDGGVH